MFLIIPKRHEKACNMSEEMTRNLHYQAKSVSNVLQTLKLSYFLCYGSLWGALYIQNILPWDTSVDYCITNEEVSKLDQAHMMNLFSQNNLKLEYNNQDGLYDVTNKTSKFGHVHLIVFEYDSRTENMRRVGWKNRVIPPDMCETIHCFPPKLIEPPLPQITFGNLEVPVPHEEIEMLKYLYPNDWWKELKARDCI